ncbi:hypothetical protein BJX63DRAFT_28711 [Aspergillus granulosus]|uniref:Uncharacterized protein n=1 Tax=Aspergillus granulosus TaxID=176169 RepID=A0ABR4HVN1_9EURO
MLPVRLYLVFRSCPTSTSMSLHISDILWRVSSSIQAKTGAKTIIYNIKISASWLQGRVASRERRYSADQRAVEGDQWGYIAILGVSSWTLVSVVERLCCRSGWGRSLFLERPNPSLRSMPAQSGHYVLSRAALYFHAIWDQTIRTRGLLGSAEPVGILL